MISIILSMLTEGFRKKIERDGGLEEGTLKIDLTPEGYIYIDGNVSPNVVSNDNKTADCTLTTTAQTLLAMITGQIDGVSAFQHGKITVEGDLRIVMVMGPIGVSRMGPQVTAPDWDVKGNLRFPFPIPDPHTTLASDKAPADDDKDEKKKK